CCCSAAARSRLSARSKSSRSAGSPRPTSPFSNPWAHGPRKTTSGSQSRNGGRTTRLTQVSPRRMPKSPRLREMTTRKANRLVAFSIALLALAGTAAAQGVAWQDLSDGQRRLLAPHEQRWADLDPQRQEQIARGAERYLEMNRGDRAQARDSFEIWQGMS